MKKIKIPKGLVRASFQSETFNEEQRTVELVWSTGGQVKRYSWMNGEYIEELSMKKADINLDRLNAGAPLLNNHQRYSLEDSIGVVEKAWIKDKKGHALVRFSSREEIQGIVKDVQEKIIRNVSVGYRVHKFEDVTKKGDEIPTYRAVDWEPMEISLVNIPADAASQVRSEKEEDHFEIEIIENKEREMPKAIKDMKEKKELIDSNEPTDVIKTKSDDSNNEPTPEPAAVEPKEEPKRSEPEKKTPEVNADEVRELEKTRGIEIRKACKTAKLDPSFAESLIEKNVNIEDARSAVIDEMAKRDAKTKTNNIIVGGNDVDQRTLRLEAAANSIMHRATGGKTELIEGAKEYRGMSLLRLAEEILTAKGDKVRGLTSNEIAERALHHTSDFIEILANVAGKSLRAGYDDQPQSYGSFTREVTVNDFKEISRTQLGDAPALEKVNEDGEYKHGSMSEAAEKYSIATYGKIVGITRQTLVNDDLDAFSRLPEMFGRRSRDLESDLIYKEITSNPVMADGKTLFHADHGNLAGAGAVVGVTTIGAARLAMRLQKGLSDRLIKITPKNILIPVALETSVEQFLGQIVPSVNGEVNPFTGKLGMIPEALLDADSATAWYLLAVKGQIDMIELARLAGQSGPTLSSKAGFEVDGVKFKISYDIGAKVIDHRGFYKNVGA